MTGREKDEPDETGGHGDEGEVKCKCEDARSCSVSPSLSPASAVPTVCSACRRPDTLLPAPCSLCATPTNCWSSMFNTARNALLHSRWRVYSAVLPVAVQQRPRTISTASFDPTIRQFLVKLGEQQPCFPMNSASVSILHEPRLFYQTLIVREHPETRTTWKLLMNTVEYDTKCTI